MFKTFFGVQPLFVLLAFQKEENVILRDSYHKTISHVYSVWGKEPH